MDTSVLPSQSATAPTISKPPRIIKHRKRNGLTYKERTFAEEYAKTHNGTRSALKAYDVKNLKTASVIASENLAKPRVINRIDQIMKQAKYNPVNSVRSVMSIEEKASKNKMTYGHSLKASEMLLKLSNTLVEKTQHTTLNMNIDSMDSHDLLILKKKYDKLLEK